MGFIVKQSAPRDRQGVIIVLSAILMVVIFSMAALAIDMGFMFVVRTQLQAAADSGALAAGNSLHLTPAEVIAVGEDFATRHEAGGRAIRADETTVELGIWDADAETFTVSGAGALGNAVKVTVERQDEALFFARVMGTNEFTTSVSAIAMANPKDIVFVVDLSGSMNDDTEPAWATQTVNSEFGPAGFPNVGTDLMTDVYQDLGFGSFPGTQEYLGAPLGTPQTADAYVEMTKDTGPLSGAFVPAAYRILPTDSEEIRKRKGYSWVIDNQLARLMPNASPTPNSGANYDYWEKYLDYVLIPKFLANPNPPPPPPPGPPSPPSPPPNNSTRTTASTSATTTSLSSPHRRVAVAGR